MSQYLIPTLLAVLVTFIVLIPIVIIESFVSMSQAFAPTGLLIYWIDSFIPGLVAAQLFRLPRRVATSSIADEAQPAV